jgi:stage V sporulation protein S
MEVLKVSASSTPKKVAGALAAVVRGAGQAEVQAVGAGAVNQAVKAIAIARGFVAPNGIDLIAIPAFAEIDIDGEERTAIRFLCQGRSAPVPLDLDGRYEAKFSSELRAAEPLKLPTRPEKSE